MSNPNISDPDKAKIKAAIFETLVRSCRNAITHLAASNPQSPPENISVPRETIEEVEKKPGSLHCTTVHSDVKIFDINLLAGPGLPPSEATIKRLALELLTVYESTPKEVDSTDEKKSTVYLKKYVISARNTYVCTVSAFIVEHYGY